MYITVKIEGIKFSNISFEAIGAMELFKPYFIVSYPFGQDNESLYRESWLCQRRYGRAKESQLENGDKSIYRKRVNLQLKHTMTTIIDKRNYSFTNSYTL